MNVCPCSIEKIIYLNIILSLVHEKAGEQVCSRELGVPALSHPAGSGLGTPVLVNHFPRQVRGRMYLIYPM